MPSTGDLHLTLPPDLIHFVEERMRAGRGASAEDVVRDALELLRQQELDLSPGHRATLRAQIAEGLSQAHRGELVDGESAFDALESRLS